MIRWGASLFVAFLLAPTPASTPASTHATGLFRLADSQLDEISGIAAGIRSPGVVYVQNDSGDLARFFALDKTSGRVLAQYTVPDAVNIDWEDIAVAPDAHGTPSVWLADIGDNDQQRKQIQLYRVDEPRVPMTGHDAQLTATRPDAWRLRYPDGPHDAESLAVTPTGIPYVITKSVTGTSEVFAASPHPGTGTLRKVGTIRFHLTGTPGPFAPLGELTATGADLSRDGTRLVVRTYTDAYLWTVHSGDVAAALRTTPQRIALPRQPQGEGICFDGSRLLIDSEHVGSVVYALPVPASSAPTRPSISVRSTARADVASVRHDRAWWLAGIAVVGAAALASTCAARRRRRDDRPGRRQDLGP